MEKTRPFSESSMNLEEIEEDGERRIEGRSRKTSLCVNTNNIPYLPTNPKHKSYEEDVRFCFV